MISMITSKINWPTVGTWPYNNNDYNTTIIPINIHHPGVCTITRLVWQTSDARGYHNYQYVYY